MIGAGAGGMSAALTGAIAGLEVLLCEKTGMVGGTTATSGGTIWVPGMRGAWNPTVAPGPRQAFGSVM